MTIKITASLCAVTTLTVQSGALHDHLDSDWDVRKNVFGATNGSNHPGETFIRRASDQSLWIMRAETTV